MNAGRRDAGQAFQAASFLLCAALAIKLTRGLEATEFSGGWPAGPLLSMADDAIILFILALVLTFLFPRTGAVIGIASSLLSLPLYFFLIAPVPFAGIFAPGHEFKVQTAPGFHCRPWPVAASLAIAIAIYFSVRRLATNSRMATVERAQRSNMRSAALAFAWLACSAHGQKLGSICVAPNANEAPKAFSPGQYYNPATLLLRIDRRKAIPWPHDKPVKIVGLTLDERHLIALSSDGKPLQALRFRFSEYPQAELCMSFDGYQGVQLYDKARNRRRAKYCGCTCE